MGLLDSFTSDTPVEIKQPDYYRLVREAAKGELLLNGIKARVPSEYLEAMATGRKIEREVEENAGNTENTGRHGQRPS